MLKSWMFNPGDPNSCDCGPEPPTPCADVCVTARGGEGDWLLPRATVEVRKGTTWASGVPVGTCETDDSGRCCLTTEEPGTYTLRTSKPGYETVESTAVVAECGDPIEEETELPRIVPTGPKCVTVDVVGCGCGVPFAAVTVSDPGGAWTISGEADGGGRFVFCFPEGFQGFHATYDWTASAPLYVTQSGTRLAEGAASGLTITLATQDPGERFCLGGNPPICREPVPETVHMTFSGAWEFGLPGMTFTLDRDRTFAGATWTACVANPSEAAPPQSKWIIMQAFVHIGPGCSVPSGTALVGFSYDCATPASPIIDLGQISSDRPVCPVGYLARNSTTPYRYITITA